MHLRLEELDATIQRTTNINFKGNIDKQIKLVHLIGFRLGEERYSFNDLGALCVKKKLQCSVNKDFLSEARPHFNLRKQPSFRASLNLLAECKLF